MLSWQCQWGVSCNILINRSVSQVFHNSSHKVASGRVPAKVSCPYLGCAHRYTQTHTIEGYKERWELKERGRGRGRTLQTMCRHSLPLTDRHSHTDTAASVSYTCFSRIKAEAVMHPFKSWTGYVCHLEAQPLQYVSVNVQQVQKAVNRPVTLETKA